MSFKTTVVFHTLLDAKNRSLTADRTVFLDLMKANGKTSGYGTHYSNDNDEVVSERIWVDEASGNDYIAFLSTTTTKYNISLVSSSISEI
jgi:hypothetical protein